MNLGRLAPYPRNATTDPARVIGADTFQVTGRCEDQGRANSSIANFAARVPKKRRSVLVQQAIVLCETQAIPVALREETADQIAMAGLYDRRPTMMPCQRPVGLGPDEKMLRHWPRRKLFGTKVVNRLKISTIESENRVTQATGEMRENLSLLFRATEELNLSAHGLQSRRTLIIWQGVHEPVHG